MSASTDVTTGSAPSETETKKKTLDALEDMMLAWKASFDRIKTEWAARDTNQLPLSEAIAAVATELSILKETTRPFYIRSYPYIKKQYSDFFNLVYTVHVYFGDLSRELEKLKELAEEASERALKVIIGDQDVSKPYITTETNMAGLVDTLYRAVRPHIDLAEFAYKSNAAFIVGKKENVNDFATVAWTEDMGHWIGHLTSSKVSMDAFSGRFLAAANVAFAAFEEDNAKKQEQVLPTDTPAVPDTDIVEKRPRVEKEEVVEEQD